MKRRLSYMVFASLFVIGCGSGGGQQDQPGITWTDPATGLMWQVQGQDLINWQESIEYCSNLRQGGYTDWRLPTISELRSLIRGCEKTITKGACGVSDYCLNSQKCNNTFCQGCSYGKGPANGCYWPEVMQGPCDYYWSSSSDIESFRWAWSVNFSNGAVYLNVDKNNNDAVRCVRP